MLVYIVISVCNCYPPESDSISKKNLKINILENWNEMKISHVGQSTRCRKFGLVFVEPRRGAIWLYSKENQTILHRASFAERVNMKMLSLRLGHSLGWDKRGNEMLDGGE